MATKNAKGKPWTIFYTIGCESRVFSQEVVAHTAKTALTRLEMEVGPTNDYRVFKGSLPEPVLSAY